MPYDTQPWKNAPVYNPDDPVGTMRAFANFLIAGGLAKGQIWNFRVQMVHVGVGFKGGTLECRFVGCAIGTGIALFGKDKWHDLTDKLMSPASYNLIFNDALEYGVDRHDITPQMVGNKILDYLDNKSNVNLEYIKFM